jgi:hypothetical protein
MINGDSKEFIKDMIEYLKTGNDIEKVKSKLHNKGNLDFIFEGIRSYPESAYDYIVYSEEDTINGMIIKVISEECNQLRPHISCIVNNEKSYFDMDYAEI